MVLEAQITARIGVLTLLIAGIVAGSGFGVDVSRADTLVDPEVRALTSVGCARVIVILQIPETADQVQHAGAIGLVQEAVLARLPQHHASLVRRYDSIPMLALEIDATGLQALETMTDVIVSVMLDRVVKPQ